MNKSVESKNIENYHERYTQQKKKKQKKTQQQQQQKMNTISKGMSEINKLWKKKKKKVRVVRESLSICRQPDEIHYK